MSTFGNTTIGGSGVGMPDTTIGIKATSPSDVRTSKSISFYAQGTKVQDIPPIYFGVSVTCAIYDDTGNLIVCGDSVTPSVPNWYTATCITNLIPNTDYIITVCAVASPVNTVYEDAGTGYDFFNTSCFSTTPFSNANFYSIYVTYDPIPETIASPIPPFRQARIRTRSR